MATFHGADFSLSEPTGFRFLGRLPMTKRALLQQIIARLESEVARFTATAQATHELATDEENRAEDKYDTRGLEASYLAIGQARQAEETAQALQAYTALALRDFAAADPIGLGALVTLATGRQTQRYFLGPRAGGMEVEHPNGTVLVITPQSPLGRQLLGHQQGDTFPLELGGRRAEARITLVA